MKRLIPRGYSVTKVGGLKTVQLIIEKTIPQLVPILFQRKNDQESGIVDRKIIRILVTVRDPMQNTSVLIK